jgi:hypothetical protein
MAQPHGRKSLVHTYLKYNEVMKKNKLTIFIVLIIVFIFGYFLGGLFKDDKNSKLIYDDTGFPINCRAIVKTNYEGFRSGIYKAEDALETIQVGCGEYGMSW